MAIILNIETTTKNCSIVLAQEEKILAVEEMNDGNYNHAELLNPFIESVLKKSNMSFRDLDAIAISKGPGSYTGLRIGVSAAKGLCFALNIPLLGIDTLSTLAKSISIESGYIIPVLDARRMEVYCCVFNAENQILQSTQAIIIEQNTFDTWLEKDKVHFVGDAVEKIKSVITHPNAVLHKNSFPSATNMVQLSIEAFQKQKFEDLAYFEPFYLKDFIVTKKI